MPRSRNPGSLGINYSADAGGSATSASRIGLATALLALAGCEAGGDLRDRQVPAPRPVATATGGAVYQTYGVHNSPGISPCQARNCVYPRGKGEPADPLYPPYWVSNWTMYRVFGAAWQRYPPPYRGRPPAGLVAGQDYEVSYGTTYYDSTWRGPTGEGAMMEHYAKRCLPIFPFQNSYTCSFISLGDAAFFVTYDADRPKGMPPVCLFSSFNHPPRRDFIKHLPYAAGDSAAIGTGGQGYSFWIKAAGGVVTQAGVAPVPPYDPGDPQILFGYGFQGGSGGQLPQSFYFSGVAQLDGMGPGQFFAPFVSQNYTGFAPTRPDPRRTWDQVAKLRIADLPRCQLFDPPAGALFAAGRKTSPTWGDIGRWGRRR